MKCDKRRIVEFLFFIIAYIFIVLLFVVILMLLIFCYNGEAIKALICGVLVTLLIFSIIVLDTYRKEVLK